MVVTILACFPQTTPIVDAKKSLVSRTILTCSRYRNKEDLAKSTGVVSAKYPSKVKLENVHNSKVPELG